MTNRLKALTRREAMLAAAGTLAAPAVLSSLPSVVEAAAPMQGASHPSHYRFKLGGFEVTTIWDGAIQLDGPHPIFGENQTQEDVAKLAEENHLPGSRMEISFTPVIVNTGREVIMFDSGNGNGRRPNAGHLAEALGRAGFTPDQIDIVVLTHFHPDHIGGLMEGGGALFPNARYVTGATEYDFWSPPEMAEGNLARVGKLVQSNVVPFAEKMTFLKPGEDVVTGIQAVGAPGHTPGHMAIISKAKAGVCWPGPIPRTIMSHPCSGPTGMCASTWTRKGRRQPASVCWIWLLPTGSPPRDITCRFRLLVMWSGTGLPIAGCRQVIS